MRDLAIALLAALAIGCGHDGQASGDAGDDGSGSDDGGVEIDADPNVRGTVTVHVVDKTGATVAGLDAVFIDTDQTVTHVPTDATGAAQASVYPGAAVTIVRRRDTLGAYSMTTIESLVPGDDLKIYSASGAAPATDDAMSSRFVPLDITAAGNFTFTYPAYAGAMKYFVYTPCGTSDVAGSTAPTLPFVAGCTQPTFDVLVVAATNADVPLAWTTKQAITFAAGGSATITDTWHAPAQFDVTYTNVTNRVTGLEMNRFTPFVRGTAQTVATGTTTGSDTVVSTTKAATGLPTLLKSRFACPEGSGAGCLSTLTGTAQQTINQVIDGTAATHTLDVGANLLPWVSATYSPASTTIAVTVTGSGTYDLFEANLRYTRSAETQCMDAVDDDGDGTINDGCPNLNAAETGANCNNAVDDDGDGRVNDGCPSFIVTYTWRVFRATAGDVTFPTLPNDVPGMPNVRPTDAQGTYQVFLCESTSINGYRGAIKNVYEALGICEASSTATGLNAAKPLVPTGTSRLSQWN